MSRDYFTPAGNQKEKPEWLCTRALIQFQAKRIGLAGLDLRRPSATQARQPSVPPAASALQQLSTRAHPQTSRYVLSPNAAAPQAPAGAPA